MEDTIKTTGYHSHNIVIRGIQYLRHGEFDILLPAKDFAKELRAHGYRVVVIPLARCFRVYSNFGSPSA